MFRNIIDKWRETGEIRDKPFRSRSVKHTKITREELSVLDNLIFEDRGISLRKAKDILVLRPSKSTLGKYFKKLGWKKLSQNIANSCVPRTELKESSTLTCVKRVICIHDPIFIDETSKSNFFFTMVLKLFR